jgi:hypothetical protein
MIRRTKNKIKWYLILFDRDFFFLEMEKFQQWITGRDGKWA